MIADALRAEIERCSIELRSNNPLFSRAVEGSLRPEHIATYLASIHELIVHTPIHMLRARELATERGDAQLARHFDARRGEEHGHEAWAERDLGRVVAMQRAPVARETTPAMRAHITYVASVIEADPRHYLAYMLVAEYVTVLLGPEWLEILERRCGIPRTSMTVVGNHAELDKEHTEESFEAIDDLVGDPRQLSPMREVVRRSMQLFDSFCADVVARTDRMLMERTAHAPAA